MYIDWTWGLIGGTLLGLAAASFLLINGRIMGASGIIGGLVDGSGRSNATERVYFIAGLILAPALLALAMGGSETHLTSNIAVLVAGGLLVGIGTRIANGCTSGHGVCGLSRLSPRSLVATLTFMAAGFVTVFLIRHALGA